METYQSFITKPDINKCSDFIHYDLKRAALAITIGLDQSIDGVLSDLVVTFSHIVGFTSFDEHWHPMDYQYPETLPRLTNGSCYPFLLVKNSYWFKHLPDSEILISGEPKNFRFISNLNTLDVLSHDEPKFKWVKSESLISKKFNSNDDYYFYLQLGAEDGVQNCNEIGCDHFHILQSRKCIKHHFKMIKGYEPPEQVS
ncbi:hypothetical protein [Reinekea sp. G2M2-21]|uniref:hypothetical protein n=1 Tax=Reinekea sp. G2M2-21 TaxID=2788942 RepID=UPI0018AA23AC|nr:hypothetical protein [Reinekea sp. G2M2-21]